MLGANFITLVLLPHISSPHPSFATISSATAFTPATPAGGQSVSVQNAVTRRCCRGRDPGGVMVLAEAGRR